MISPLFAIHPTGAKRPMFLIAPAGGVTFPYCRLLPYWDNDRPLYTIQDPSLDPESPVVQTVEELARQYIDIMKAQQPNGPYIIGGWSYGGVVSLDIARQLALRGERAELVIFDTRIDGWGAKSPFARLGFARKCVAVPKLIVAVFSHTGPYFRDGMYLIFIHGKRRGLLGRCVAAIIALLVGKAPFALLIEERPHLAGMVPPGLFRCLRVLKTNVTTVRGHRPKPVHAHGALIKASDSASLGLDDPDHDMGWGEMLLDGVDVYDTPGNHVTLMLSPAIDVVGSALREALVIADERLDTLHT
ncbi:MAG: hypothetical protein FJY92_07415 [Candidatus Hydrogenedentes bacterium]|nr:hypothetical protein [Candidatus Hydrogenedentota bacterium]